MVKKKLDELNGNEMEMKMKNGDENEFVNENEWENVNENQMKEVLYNTETYSFS